MNVVRILCFSLFLVVTSFAQANQQWITTASGVRARTTPTTSSEEVARLPIGTILRQLDTEQREGTVNDKKGFWYRVALPDKKEGFVFSTFLMRFDEARKGESFKTIASAKLKAESGTFAEYADLTRWLASSTTGITDRATLAELELWRWVALQKAFMNIESDKQQQGEYQRFIKANQANAVYSEPGGMWLVKSELFWKLQKKNADLPIGDTIAWEAANLALPGECEDDDTCATMYLNETKGRYLLLYPAGRQSGQALDDLIESFRGINEQMKHIVTPKGNSKADQQIRNEAIAAINRMRMNVAKVTNPKKTKLLQLLASYERYYRKY